MPRLNLLDKSLGFQGDGADYDWYDGAGIISECYLPYHESMRDALRRTNVWWTRWNRNGPKVETANIWLFRDRVLEYNLGKSHDLAFSYYCKKTRHIEGYLSYWFKPFEDEHRRFNDYTIDSNGNIQKGPWRLRMEELRFEKNSKPYLFNSADLVLGYQRKSDGKVFTETEYSNKFYIELNTNESNFETVVIQGYQVENVQPNSKQEKRLSYERNQKKKQLDRIRKENKKQKEYSFLTKSEIEIRESKKEDPWKIQSHGFREDCFRGKEYHGRKNKKIN